MVRYSFLLLAVLCFVSPSKAQNRAELAADKVVFSGDTSSFRDSSFVPIADGTLYFDSTSGNFVFHFRGTRWLLPDSLHRDMAAFIDSLAGAGADTSGMVSNTRHDWNISGRKNFRALVMIFDSLRVGVFDSSLQYGRFAVRTSDTTRERSAVQFVDNGLRGTLFRVRNDGIVHMPNQSAASAYISSNQSYTGGTYTKVDFNSESFDHREEFSLTTDNYHCTADGIYLVTAAVEATFSAATDNVFLMIYEGGSLVRTGALTASAYTGFVHYARAEVTGILNCSAGDVIDIRFHAAAAATLQSGSNISYISIVKLL